MIACGFLIRALIGSLRRSERRWASSFLLLGATLAAAGMGWFKRRLWGWRLAVAIIAIQVLGGFVNVFLGRIVEGGIGVAIAGALLFYLLRAKVRAVFKGGGTRAV